ncbi:3',5'-cyclic adenosine monophosphate phosphodiesterase CpdA [bacterium BMS3Bbin10]|nr:3',5'-cyclic adenosine monophosphate phosphodiesterase CpdA [bacterium BMS3Bbin10]
MIIAQISDTHIALDTPDADRRLRDFAQTIADINALEPQPDVIVHTGDIVHNGRREEYMRAREILGKARAPVFVLAGNKDDRENLHEAFAERGYLAPNPEFIDYAVEDFPVRLIALDTLSARGNKGDFCEARAQRLIGLIEAEPARPIAVFTHHPPFEVTQSREPHQFETRDMAVRLRRALQHSDRVRAVFSGHVHRAALGNVKAIRAATMPSTATSLRKGDYPADMKTAPVYQLHRFDSGGGFTSETRIVRSGLEKPIPHKRTPLQVQALSRP